MSRDSGPVSPLEQRCVRPGHWVIEGYDVMRRSNVRPDSTWWVIGKLEFSTLAEARDWIREERGL